MSILPMNTESSNGWRNLNLSQMENKTKEELKEALEKASFLYDDVGSGSEKVHSCERKKTFGLNFLDIS